jgi:glycosyltransferase involved in cell wall biosynthesis
MPKISVLIGYYERPSQFKLTLDSYVHWYEGRDYEFVVINDGSRIPITRMIEAYSSKLNIVYREVFRDKHFNPGEVYNLAASIATSDVLFLTNPENIHLGDVFGEVEKHSAPMRYLCFSCASFHSIDSFKNMLDCPDRFIEGVTPYYQHSEHSNRILHFASSIMKKDWESVGGFSSIYDDGCAYEDNDLVEELIARGFEFYIFDNVGVAHLPHIRFTREELIIKNQKIFEKKWGYKARDSYPEAKIRIFK